MVEAKHRIKTAIYASIIVFCTYTFIFGLRKSFTICTFDNLRFLKIDYKIWLVIFQMLGYLSAKFFGIVFISQLKKSKRLTTLVLLLLWAWLAWLLFALIPAPYNMVFLFLNGFPLGLIWGIIFSYIEGRKTTDLISTCLAVSFIFSTGFVKTIGLYLRSYFSVNEYWIPFVTGLVFLIPLAACLFFLNKIPLPSLEDIDARTERVQMDATMRKKVFKQYAGGILCFIFIYLCATIFRDLRDNFSLEMWLEMGYQSQPSLFTKTEVFITIILLVIMGSTVLIKNNKLAFNLGLVWMGLGFILAGGVSYLFKHQLISPFYWFLFVGLGLYLVYIPFNCFFFDRFIAAFKIKGTVGFFIYLVDAIGYIGSITIMATKNFFHLKLSWLHFFIEWVMYLSIFGVFIALVAWIYFREKSLKT
ncbi:MAG: DUF5690 family protein [Alphaproteobacteria bacterium]|nr:DUF5690 family protein [Alphaproteobacteria bacterium]